MKKSPFIGLVFFATVVIAGSAAAQSPVPVTTYHYDNLRTGWNNQETTLTPANVNQTTFGILPGGTIKLDEQVDAQPLIAPKLTIAGGTHDVVYVATARNTIYAIDASSGAILLSTHLGSPVPASRIGCFNNANNVGITGTPVIDLTSQTLYVIAYTLDASGSPTFKLHALDLVTLKDKGVSPVTVAASHKLTNGSKFTFNAKYQRQRPALLELNGNVYAAFGSYCDFHADRSRGWLLGWNASTLKPLAGNQLDDTQVKCTTPVPPCSPTNYFLSSIWMSGYGIGGTGTQLYFATGNSAQKTYDGVTNIQESVVKLEGDLTHRPLGIFTPSNVTILDQQDADLGSGGVLLLPDQNQFFPHLAVVGGKDGRLFLLNRDNLGGFTPGGPNKVLDTHQLQACWCGPSWFTGSDGIGRVVTSHGSSSPNTGTLQTWKLNLSSTMSPPPTLVTEATASIASGNDPGFFTSVSSDNVKPNTGIIWAVGRPTDKTTTFVNLYAFNATASGTTLTQLFSSPAGSWPHTAADANIVPVVANGKVYVAANKQLTIFGILPAHAAPQIKMPPTPIASLSSPHVISGTLLAVDGSTLTLQTRTGISVKIDDSQAAMDGQIGPALIGGVPLTALGSSFNASGALLATSVFRAKGSSGELWPPDL